MTSNINGIIDASSILSLTRIIVNIKANVDAKRAIVTRRSEKVASLKIMYTHSPIENSDKT